MRYYLDRFEGAVAVLEGTDGSRLLAAVSALPAGVREGAVLKRENGIFTPDPVAEAARRSRLFRLQERMKRRD